MGPKEEMLWDLAAGARDPRNRSRLDVTAWRERVSGLGLRRLLTKVGVVILRGRI